MTVNEMTDNLARAICAAHLREDPSKIQRYQIVAWRNVAHAAAMTFGIPLEELAKLVEGEMLAAPAHQMGCVCEVDVG